jgi:hypothetical protein
MRLRAMRVGFANAPTSDYGRNGASCCPRPQCQKSQSQKTSSIFNVPLVEAPSPFIALCDSSGVSPQCTLRGMAAMVCGLRYDENNRLLPLEDADF